MHLSLFQSILTLNLTRSLSFRIKTTQRFLGVSSHGQHMPTCLYCLLVAWQYGTHELFFGMIITDPEHWRLRLKWRDYHGVIAQRTPYKSHNAKRTWFVLVFDVIVQWVYQYYLLRLPYFCTSAISIIVQGCFFNIWFMSDFSHIGWILEATLNVDSLSWNK